MNTQASTPPNSGQEPVESNHFSIYVLFGFALLGLLVTRIWDFAGFTTNEQLFYLLAKKGGNYQLLNIVSLLFGTKMIAILAILVGAGIIIFLQKKDSSPSLSQQDAFIRRQLWYIFFGLFCAFIILAPDDILYHFGIAGILLFAFWKISVRGLLITALICICIYSGKLYWNYNDNGSDLKKYTVVTAIEKKFKIKDSLRVRKDSLATPKDSLKSPTFLAKRKITDSLAKKNDTLTTKQAGEKGKWESIIKNLKYDSSKTIAKNKAMRAGYKKSWFHLKGIAQDKESYWLYSIGVWDIGSMMLLGMALLGLGFFHQRFTVGKYLLFALIGIAVGLALAYYRMNNNHIRLQDYAKYIQGHSLPYNQFLPIEQLFLVVGYISLMMALIQQKVIKWFWVALSAVGRMVLSNYFLQTLICAFWFYGYGAGFYGRFQQWELYFIVVLITLVQIVFSIIWLRNYQTGPAEWLLNCLINRKWQPIKKQAHSVN